MSKSPCQHANPRRSRILADLRRVRAAIRIVERDGVQSMTSGGGASSDSYTKLPLATLYERETMLLQRLGRLKRNGKPFGTIRTNFF